MHQLDIWLALRGKSGFLQLLNLDGKWYSDVWMNILSSSQISSQEHSNLNCMLWKLPT